MWASSLPKLRAGKQCLATVQLSPWTARRQFHDYFITHLPSTSLHPDSRSAAGPHHKLPRDKSTPHDAKGGSIGRTPTAAPPMVGLSRDMTVVRIPLKSAKHHFGATLARGTRPYNEDAYQAGTIDIPAFAKRRPISLTRNNRSGAGPINRPADTPSGDPQVFYYGVFDGHGGSECSGFLREQLHTYIEEASKLFGLNSSLKKKDGPEDLSGHPKSSKQGLSTEAGLEKQGQSALDSIDTHTPPGTEHVKPPAPESGEKPPSGKASRAEPPESSLSVNQSQNIKEAERLEKELSLAWKQLVGGYYRRFKPEYFAIAAGGRGHRPSSFGDDAEESIGIETVLTYAFLKADLDFVSAQVTKKDEDPVLADRAINDTEVLGEPSATLAPSHRPIGGTKRFKGGSTCSIALISTPTAAPYWHPSSACTITTAHVGDTRILLCNTATGLAVPLTSNHHPSLPEEATRLRRYAATFVTDSFGEERMSGLANTRAFGDMASKRIGVSAEPEVRRIDVSPAEYAFLVLVSDGVSGPLSDQEIVDVAKEARTPEQAARDIVSLATTVVADADNATAVVVRLGGWERRSEGGLGSLGTKELRDWRKNEAETPRRRM